MKSIIFILYFLFASFSSLKAQNITVEINFEVDGLPKMFYNGYVVFYFNKDTIQVNIEKGNALVPEFLFKKRLNTVFSFDKYYLIFDSIPITINASSPKWTLGIDNRPFDKKKHWPIKFGKNISVVYYLNNDDGRTFTVTKKKRSAVIK